NLAFQARRLVHQGIDPIEARRADKRRLYLEAARGKTFRECTAEYLALNAKAWRSAKHAVQWKSSIERYAYPVIADVPVHLIDTALMLKILAPLWQSKVETGSRLRLRIAKVIDYGRAHGHSDKPNPAAWDNLKNVLPSPTKLTQVRHMPALA